ncbi:HpcH/HpaI aldolase family protein [Halospeciosus flavus]|uniref:HpcH/HpaI aldolase/citrate lyase family protein n=1 Tax=Halospeciosus flavus TaxID=3032283 RepID=A0ABD5Z1T2_9EURY|nr:aldolase/citrate lyase family protein [Halospeciosus flavus]
MTDPISENDLRTTFESGGVALSVLESAYSTNLVEFYGELGADAVWLDLEHGGPSPWDGERLNDFLRAAERGGTELLVRTPEADPAMVRKCLDAGVRNVFVPRVETADEVRDVCEAARFDYDDEPGERGLANPRASRWGLQGDYPATEDRETLVGVTVETREAVENLDAILDVPDLGFVFAGPLDLSAAYGHPGERDHPEVQAAVETIEEKTLEADVPLGGLGFGVDDLNAKVQRGYQLLNCGSTTGALKSAVSGWLETVERDSE